MDLSKLESQKKTPPKEIFSLDEQIREVLIQLEPLWVEKKLQLNINLSSISYYGSRELLSHVWKNILENAIKYSHIGGELVVSSSDSKSHCVISITDYGLGMNEETLKHVFDRFYQGDTSRSHQGYGLGLTLAKRIVDLSSGMIEVKSKLGKGSTFLVSLPMNP